MSDSDSLSCPRRSDSESEPPGKSSVDSTLQLGVNVCAHAVDLIQAGPFSKIGKNFSTRSAHYQGNRAGHVPLEEAESCKGEELLETPTLTQPQRNTLPTLSCHHGWAMGRGRGRPRVGAKISRHRPNILRHSLTA